MKLENIIYDIREVVRQIKGEKDLSDMHLAYMVNAYRSTIITQKYLINPVVYPEWKLYYILTLIEQASIVIGQGGTRIFDTNALGAKTGYFPNAIPLPSNAGFRISDTLQKYTYPIMSMEELELLRQIDPTYSQYPANYCPCAIVGNMLIVYKLTGSNVLLNYVPEDPLLVPVYNLNDGTTTQRTILDEYPLDMDSAQQVVLNILAKEFQIINQTVYDLLQNAQNDFKLLQLGTTPA